MLLFAIFADDVLNATVGETVGSALRLKGLIASVAPVEKLRLGCLKDFTGNRTHSVSPLFKCTNSRSPN
jgi:hypothetical protein